MAWIYLVIAGITEIGWALGLKYTEGWTKLIPSILTIIGMVVSFYFLSLSLKTIPVSTGYAVWTGIGAFGTAMIGMFLLGEPSSVLKVICVLLIVAGVVGLKLVSTY